MTSTTIGRNAENIVASYLIVNGHKILAQNWRTKSCEIDIITVKNNRLHFIEVKYRSSNMQGTGFDYITKTKFKQMIYAANLWTAKNNYTGDYTLMAAEVDFFGNVSLVDLF